MYDPFVDHTIPANQSAINSYWHSTSPVITTPSLANDVMTDIVIVGSGYTGLNCAIELSGRSTNDVVVLEANSIGWGCSSRNAGFVLPGSGRLSYPQLVQRFGMDQAQILHQHYLEAIDLVKQRLQTLTSEADRTEQGYLKLAHSAKWFDKLQETSDYLASKFNYMVETIDRSDFESRFVRHTKIYGAVRYQNGFGINPLKLINHYANIALENGVDLYSNTPAVEIAFDNQLKKHVVVTANGRVFADKLVIATNGYTPKGLATPLSKKVLPVLTSVIVTRPLSPKELNDSNFLSNQVMMDTRELKYYYRLLPDNRILFGGRSAISGQAASNPKYQQRLLQELKSTFIGLNNVSTEYAWSGWISVAFDQMPHLFRTADDIYYATGYCGSGVSFSAWAGKELANLVLETSSRSPLMTELPAFPFAPMRRVGQRMFYQYGRLKDALG